MKKTIITITIAFMVFILAVVGKNAFSKDLPNGSMGVQAAISRGRSSATEINGAKIYTGIDNLFIGASSFRKGINMHTIENDLNGQSFMVVYNGNQPMNMDVELSEIIEANVVPKNLIVEFDPAMISNHADLSDKRLLFDIDMDSKVKIWRDLSSREDADFFMFYDYWVSSNIDYLATYPVSYPLISKRYYLGGNNGEEFTASKSKEELDELPIKEDAGFNELQKSSIMHIIKMCKDNGIRLIFIESPNYYTMYQDENYAGKQELLKGLLKDEGIEVYSADDLPFDSSNPEYYSDLTHMSTKGMEEYTKIVVDILK